MYIEKEDAIIGGIALAIVVGSVGAAMYFEGKARGLSANGPVKAMAADMRKIIANDSKKAKQAKR